MADRPTWEPRVVILSVAIAAAVALVGLGLSPTPNATNAGLTRGQVQHIIEIMMENHSFDNYFGVYPGTVDGLPRNITLPTGTGSTVSPYWIGANSTPSPPHDRSSEIADLDGGRMDGFVEQMGLADPAAMATPMGYYNASEIGGYWSLAEEFLLCDHYFASVLGPTLPNRLYAIAGSSAGVTEDALPVSGLALETIFDELSTYGLGWKYFYAPGGMYAPVPLWLSPLRQNPAEVADVLPMSGLLPAITAGNLPAVTFVDPSEGSYSEQPPHSVAVGETWALSDISAIEASPDWNSTVVFLTWDEGGGFYDHVVPPTIDPLGDGFRVPMLVVSPFTEHAGVSSVVEDHTSVLRFIDDNWNLALLNGRVAEANDIGSVLRLPSASHELGPAHSGTSPRPGAPMGVGLGVQIRVPSGPLLARGTSFVGARRSPARVGLCRRSRPNERAVFSRS